MTQCCAIGPVNGQVCGLERTDNPEGQVISNGCEELTYDQPLRTTSSTSRDDIHMYQLMLRIATESEEQAAASEEHRDASSSQGTRTKPGR